MTETDLMNMIRIKVSRAGHKIFRTNVGKIRMADGRWFDTGLPKGHSDLYGFRKDDGRVFYIEVKISPNKPSKEQLQFLSAMKAAGALGGVAYSIDDALKIIRGDNNV